MKECTKCNKLKSIDQFIENDVWVSGYNPYCITCQAELKNTFLPPKKSCKKCEDDLTSKDREIYYLTSRIAEMQDISLEQDRNIFYLQEMVKRLVQD